MRRVLGSVLVLLALGSCSDDDDEPRAATTTTTSEAPRTCPSGEPELPNAADGAPAEVVATTGDLRLAVVDRGASVEVISIFRIDGCDVHQLRIGAEPVALPVGGTVTHGDGIECRDDDAVVVRSATSDDGETYQATAIRYRVDGDSLVEVERSASTIEASEDPDRLQSYYSLDC